MSENGGPCTSFWEGTETETAAADNLQTDGYPKDNRIKAMLKVDITKHLENYHKRAYWSKHFKVHTSLHFQGQLLICHNGHNRNWDGKKINSWGTYDGESGRPRAVVNMTKWDDFSSRFRQTALAEFNYNVTADLYNEEVRDFTIS